MPYNSTNQLPGPNPCLTSVTYQGATVDYRSYLNDRDVVFATFAVQVDTLAAVRMTAAEQQQLFAAVKASGMKHVISVAAFRGQNRSEAHYIESDTSALGAGRRGGLGGAVRVGHPPHPPPHPRSMGDGRRGRGRADGPHPQL